MSSRPLSPDQRKAMFAKITGRLGSVGNIPPNEAAKKALLLEVLRSNMNEPVKPMKPRGTNAALIRLLRSRVEP